MPTDQRVLLTAKILSDFTEWNWGILSLQKPTQQIHNAENILLDARWRKSTSFVSQWAPAHNKSRSKIPFRYAYVSFVSGKTLENQSYFHSWMRQRWSDKFLFSLMARLDCSFQFLMKVESKTADCEGLVGSPNNALISMRYEVYVVS